MYHNLFKFTRNGAPRWYLSGGRILLNSWNHFLNTIWSARRLRINDQLSELRRQNYWNDDTVTQLERLRKLKGWRDPLEGTEEYEIERFWLRKIPRRSHQTRTRQR